MARVGKKSREEKLREVLSVLRGESAAVARRGLRVSVGLGVVVVVLSVAVVSLPAAAQDAGVDVRIVARKLDSGKIEFGLREQQSDGSWGEPLLPARRLFPATAAVGSWLVSSSLSLGVANSAESVRIVARRLADGRVEFALQQQLADNSWGDRMLPTKRLFPTTARVHRWLQSSPLTITTTTAPVEDQQVEEDIEEPTTTTTVPVEEPPVQRLVRPVDPDVAAEYARLSSLYSECGFEAATLSCNNPNFDLNDFIQAVESFFGCEWDLRQRGCHGMTTYEHYISAVYPALCDGWIYDRYDGKCYSWEHPRYQ